MLKTLFAPTAYSCAAIEQIQKACECHATGSSICSPGADGRHRLTTRVAGNGCVFLTIEPENGDGQLEKSGPTGDSISLSLEDVKASAENRRLISDEVDGPVRLVRRRAESLGDEGSPCLGQGGVFAAKGCDVDRDFEQEPRFVDVGDRASRRRGPSHWRGASVNSIKRGSSLTESKESGAGGAAATFPLGDEPVGGYAGVEAIGALAVHVLDVSARRGHPGE